MRIKYENHEFINAATGENLESALSGRCVERSLALAFDLDVQSVMKNVRTKTAMLTLLSMKGYSLIRTHADYMVDDTPYYDTSEVDISELYYPAEKYHLNFINLYDIIEHPEIKNFDKFLINGFDIPRGCEYLPHYYRNHMMLYHGFLHDTEYDDPFYVHSIFIPNEQVTDFQKLESTIKNVWIKYDNVSFEVHENCKVIDLNKGWIEPWGYDEKQIHTLGH